MSRHLLWIIIAAALVIAFSFYRYLQGRNLNIDPHAREEIDRAKRR
jgi:hypothetical protein